MIRAYNATDRQACLDIFDSNCPQYFAPSERKYIENWLTAQNEERPTYPNSAEDRFYVLEYEGKIVACGGFYLLKDENSASISWGMVHADHHKKGFGRDLFQYRLEVVRQLRPGVKILLDTSQHTFGFFEKMGMKVKEVTEDGYGAGLDRYDME
jgi:GNAT superfamily N-acetyltransferase